MDAAQLKSSPYVLIRHGLSKFNYAALVAKTEHGEDSPEFRAVEADPNMIDPELHDVGIMQCEAQHAVVNTIDWQVVFTSPMQRAMMTTVHMFKSHPNKDKIKFVVVPMVREILHTTNDIAMDCDELMAKYGEGQPAACGIKFDFSRFFLYGIPQLWQVFTLANVRKQQEIISQLVKTNPEANHEAPQKTNVIEVLKSTFAKYDKAFEDVDSLLRRATVIDDFLKEHLRCNPLEGDQKYAVVCHSMIIATMTSEGADPSD